MHSSLKKFVVGTISAAAFVALPGSAQASPMPANTPACTQYAFGASSFAMTHDNDVVVTVATAGSDTVGNADYDIPNKTAPTYGTAHGGIKGNHIEIDAIWTSGIGSGMWSHYTGTIGEDGIARGESTNSLGHNNTWNSGTTKLLCVSTPTIEHLPKAHWYATVVGEDVDLYDSTGDGKKKIGMLREGQRVQTTRDCQPQDWCRVLSEPSGYVWGHLRME